MKRAAFVLGTLEYTAIKRRQFLTDETYKLLDDISNTCQIDASIVISVMDAMSAGKPKHKLGIDAIRAERPRVLDEIANQRPDFVVCFGPVATACVFNKGNVVESEAIRQVHYPLGKDAPPVFVTYGLENVKANPGLAEWLYHDVDAATNGMVDVEFGEYTILQPGTAEWALMPQEFEGKNTVAFDLETYPGVQPWDENARIRMAVLSDRVGRATVVQLPFDSSMPTWLAELLANPGIQKCGSNIKFDYKWCKRFGYDVVNMWDTHTAEHVIDCTNPKKDLKNLSFKYVPKLGDYARNQRMMVKQRGGWEHIEDKEMYDYAGGDGEASIGTAIGQAAVLDDRDLRRPLSLMQTLYPMLCQMEHNGCRVDTKINRVLDMEYTRRLKVMRKNITGTLGPINLNSPGQLAQALKRVVPTINLSLRDLKKRLADDEESTNKIILERESHKHPVIAQVLEYRKIRACYSTFVDSLYKKYAVQHGGHTYIHPTFNPGLVETYRLSSSAPNGQNIPVHQDHAIAIKRQFVSRFEGGSILAADYSQLEIRFVAWASGDPNLMQAIESGEDIHQSMASQMLDKPVGEVTEIERYNCKRNTFLVLYGGGARKLARDLKISLKQAQKLISDYFGAFSTLKGYIDDVHAYVVKYLCVVTPFGFRRKFTKPPGWDTKEGFAIKRQSFNTIIQNGAACLMYCAMIALDQLMTQAQVKSKLILQVHDSVIIDVYPGEESIVHNMVNRAMESNVYKVLKQYGVDFTVPLKCSIEIGPNWAETKELINAS